MFIENIKWLSLYFYTNNICIRYLIHHFFQIFYNAAAQLKKLKIGINPDLRAGVEEKDYDRKIDSFPKDPTCYLFWSSFTRDKRIVEFSSNSLIVKSIVNGQLKQGVSASSGWWNRQYAESVLSRAASYLRRGRPRSRSIMYQPQMCISP